MNMNYKLAYIEAIEELEELERRINEVKYFINHYFTNEDGFIWHEDMREIYKMLGAKEDENK